MCVPPRKFCALAAQEFQNYLSIYMKIRRGTEKQGNSLLLLESLIKNYKKIIMFANCGLNFD